MPPKNASTEYQTSATPNKDIMLAKKKTPTSSNAPKKVVEIQPVLSKSVLRKMAKITREKESKKHRLHSLEILQEHQFDGDKRVLFQQSGTIGTERTKAEELARLYGLKQAGVQLDQDQTELLKEALVDFGDLDFSTAIAEKQKQSMSSHAFKTVTANPFMPLSTASATINATIQDRLLGSKAAGSRKVYNSNELKNIAENMTVNEFDLQYTKKLKKRQRREEHALVNEKLKELNSKKVHEIIRDMAKEREEGGNEHSSSLEHFKPEQLIVLPKELRGMASILTQQSGGKVRAVTSNVSGGQMHKPKNDSTTIQNNDNDDSFKAVAHLISKGLLTTKSKDKLDVLFAMNDFSDSDAGQDSDDDDSDSEDDEDEVISAASKSKKQMQDEGEEMWGVTKPNQNKQQQQQQQQQLQQANNKKKQLQNTKKQILNNDDEFVSAATAARGTNTSSKNTQPSHDDNGLPILNVFGESTASELKTTLPASLAMPTITRTNKAAVVSRTLPIALLGGTVATDSSGEQPSIIIKRQKGNNNNTNNPQSLQNSQNGMNPNQIVQLQKKEAEYSVKFQVLKSRQVRNFLQSIHDGTNADMSDAEDENTYTSNMSGNNGGNTVNNSLDDIYGNNTNNYNNNDNLKQDPDQPKKRKILFDFTQPVVVNTNRIVKSTIVIDDSTLVGKDRSVPVIAIKSTASAAADLAAANAAGPKKNGEKLIKKKSQTHDEKPSKKQEPQPKKEEKQELQLKKQQPQPESQPPPPTKTKNQEEQPKPTPTPVIPTKTAKKQPVVEKVSKAPINPNALKGKRAGPM